MNLQQEIIKKIKDSVAGLEVGGQDIKLTKPSDSSHGDYSTNIALVIAKKLGKKPMELAEELKSVLENIAGIDKAEVAEPGFINFFVAKEGLLGNLSTILEKGDNYGKSEKLKARKIMVEFTDPNPFKEFHIGHLYSNVVGEALCRLLEFQGGDIKRANYQGDVGLHVAKSIWGIPKVLEKWGETFEDQESKSLEARAFFLGYAYSWGAKEFDSNEEAKKEITEINKKIFDDNEEYRDIYQKGREWSLKYFETIYERLGTKFDFSFFESEVGKAGEKLVRENIGKVFEESEGAIIFPGKKYGLHNRVFINSLGLPTYEAKELGLAPAKYEKFPYDKSIIVTGNEINEYFKVLVAALKQILPELAAKTQHVSHGMVRFPGGKISSRLGNVLLGVTILNYAVDRARELAIKSGVETKGHEVVIKKVSGLTSEERERIYEQVGVGGLKYALLKGGIGQDILFNFDTSISLEGNSGPYIQYTYARTQSVLAKATFNNSQLTIDKGLEKEEIEILRMLSKFGEVVEEAGDNFAPSILCNYLFELSQKFNLFYQKHKIIGSEKEAVSAGRQDFRLALTKVVGQVIKNGLYLLGIQAPEKM